MSENTNTSQAVKALQAIKAEHYFTIHDGEYETCCVCGAHTPIVYTREGKPTNIGMHNPWPLVSDKRTEAHGLHCCFNCWVKAKDAGMALNVGDADALATMADEMADYAPETVTERLRGLSEGLLTGRMLEAGLQHEFDPTDGDAATATGDEDWNDVADDMRTIIATMRKVTAKLNHMADALAEATTAGTLA